MNTAQLVHAINRDAILNKMCIGVFPCDKIPLIKSIPCCLIVNEDKSTETGTHWLAMYIHDYNNCEFFDSFGRSTQIKNIRNFLRNFKNVNRTARQVQSAWSTVCGQHCLYFLFSRSRGISFSAVMNLYSKDLLDNDEAVCDFTNDMFDLSTKLTNEEYISSQFCKKLASF